MALRGNPSELWVRLLTQLGDLPRDVVLRIIERVEEVTGRIWKLTIQRPPQVRTFRVEAGGGGRTPRLYPAHRPYDLFTARRGFYGNEDDYTGRGYRGYLQ